MAVRSILFNIAFYLNIIVWMIGCTPMLLLPRRWTIGCVHGWARCSTWLLEVIGGVRVEVRGGLPRRGMPLLVAAKHQSVFETFALLPYFSDPAFILKRELTWIPLFGWWCRKMRMIPVDRGRGATALKDMARRAHAEAARGRQIVIFPEGTRRPPGAPPQYKQGVSLLYATMQVPCLPVALNSGLFWPRRKWQRYPGTILVEFLEPIPPGLDREAFRERLETAIETASDRLLGEAAAAPNPPPIPDEARARLEGMVAAATPTTPPPRRQAG
ncbi:1-acyl-sn-glycerol-3-phosphate acyltransferase [Tepidamorphus gemmatus]|uniref:1-acyl-sn-glycerol-3-phosphate acyltransferase n=1 Tax=Tepidamorphus gemmatus TaxID=747076 RepID=A0A4R3MHE6_9HYPH|nr:lysophospholipid acyltransferase family protein [Tepidamorphus gemmatus]TCT11817.1 1-acyl-sn-glycerol-3-phosphate acyltransferase [Tepidamorphus gemmatus]